MANIMTSAMEDVHYRKHNFNSDPGEERHPLWMTEKHFCYHLAKDHLGQLECIKDTWGQRIRSPRCLSAICVYSLVCSDAKVLHQTDNQYWPSNLYPIMFTEALYQREARAVDWLISTWPMRYMRVIDLVPLEDDLDPEYLTLPIDGSEDNCLIDYIILGLLKMKPESGLRVIDFTGFDKDRKLCRELCRLPYLWMKPSERTVEDIHDKITDIMEVSKDKVQRFLNRINTVYANIEKEFKHRNEMSTIDIILDLQIILDDVPFGLTLQKHSPFHFRCNRLWMRHIPEVVLPFDKLDCTLELSKITHFEFSDALLPGDGALFRSLCACLGTLTNLTAFSLPNSIDVVINQEMAAALNATLRTLSNLQRVNFSYCNLRDQLHLLLAGMRQRIRYLNLCDCRLTADDICFLVGWRPLRGLRELNLSCNILQECEQPIVQMVQQMEHISCLSLRNCQLSVHSLVLIVRECKQCSSCLKVLCVQMYTPLSRDDTLEVISTAAQIRSLQKVIVFPDVYAFPGFNQDERTLNKYHMVRFCYRYLSIKGCTGLRLD